MIDIDSAVITILQYFCCFVQCKKTAGKNFSDLYK